ncbi:MAG TPA: sigma-70 family RNA polymerase sigma factor [Acidimicrobiales bacterium]|nr:sigma-70 family RNA polymerase sigma factor [Acidimicrobiales bacterium]
MGTSEPFDLVLAAAQADVPWAYERLYKALSPSICGYLRIQGAADPEDLTSEVFLGAFRGIGTFAGDEDQFRSWVFTIAHRRLTDERRARSCRPAIADAALPDWAAGDVEEEALRRLSAERVRALCVGLAPDQADVLLLRLISGLTVEAIAGVLGKTPGAVKALQRRGLCALRRHFERQGVPL